MKAGISLWIVLVCLCSVAFASERHFEDTTRYFTREYWSMLYRFDAWVGGIDHDIISLDCQKFMTVNSGDGMRAGHRPFLRIRMEHAIRVDLRVQSRIVPRMLAPQAAAMLAASANQATAAHQEFCDFAMRARGSEQIPQLQLDRALGVLVAKLFRMEHIGVAPSSFTFVQPWRGLDNLRVSKESISLMTTGDQQVGFELDRASQTDVYFRTPYSASPYFHGWSETAMIPRAVAEQFKSRSQRAVLGACLGSGHHELQGRHMDVAACAVVVAGAPSSMIRAAVEELISRERAVVSEDTGGRAVRLEWIALYRPVRREILQGLTDPAKRRLVERLAH